MEKSAHRAESLGAEATGRQKLGWLVGLSVPRTWLAFCLPVLVLLILPHLELAAMNLSTGDHAANSLLVQKAKGLSLDHGNYSRVGFFHPGPFFFYVMAAGEVLFHDFMGLAKSPEAGHRLAIALLNLGLYGIAHGGLARYFGKPWIAGFAILLGISAIKATTPALTSVWPPDLYVAPAFLFAVSMFLLLAGESRGLPGFILGGCILIHGHASNIGLVPLMGFATVAALLVIRRATLLPVRPAAIYEWLKPHLVLSVLVAAVFALPILLHTLTNWPGEIPKYFAKASGVSNPLPAALAYTFQYWSFWFIILFAMGSLALLGRWMPVDQKAQPPLPTALPREIAALAGVVAVMSAAMVFYAVRGIDFLNETYIGFWYLGCVGGTLAILVMMCDAVSAGRWRIGGHAVAGIAAFTSLNWFAAPERPGLNNLGPEADMALSAIAKDNTTSPIAFLIDQSTNQSWVTGWPVTVGLIDRNLRQHGPRLCVAPSTWHLLFLEENRCTEDELAQAFASGSVYKVSDQLPDGPGRLTVAGAMIDRIGEGQPFGQIGFDEASRALALPMTLGDGWSVPEAELVWQISKSATLQVMVPASEFGVAVDIQLDAFLPRGDLDQLVTTRADGELIESVVLVPETASHTVRLNVPASDRSSRKKVTIEVRELYSPSTYWEGNGDTRTLGVAFRGLTITPNPPPG